MKQLLVLLHCYTLLFAAEGLTTRTQVMMGTFVSLSLPPHKEEHFEQAFSRMKAVELALSSYDPKAEIYQLNKYKEANITADTYEALSLSRRYHEETEGYFDITVGAVTKDAYRFGQSGERLPGANELLEKKVGQHALRFDRHSASLQKEYKVDLGGMGKGFAVDKAAELLRKKGVKRGIIAASGDIRCLHRCEIAIQDPFGEGVVATFVTKNLHSAVTTSGNYRRYVKDRTHSHLINPKTKASAKQFASVTLISSLPNSDIDAYATAVSVMPCPEAIALLNRIDAAYVLILINGETIVSDNIDDFVAGLRFHGDGKQHPK